MTTANVNGGSGEDIRGTWCTPQWVAEKVGAFDLDPFSNGRSHVIATRACWLERGDNGLGGKRSARGEYRWGDSQHIATDNTRVWIQPPYSIVLEALAHYEHTRWAALLRFDPSTEWFRRIYRQSALVCVTRRRINFEPPPGVKASSQPFPHAIFYKHAEDAPDAVLRSCIAWRTR